MKSGSFIAADTSNRFANIYEYVFLNAVRIMLF
jgi:hypothetical protein